MKTRLLLFFLFVLGSGHGFAQSFNSYLQGNPLDVLSSPSRGICMMGGATENDKAMQWFLQRADHGDVLVLRTENDDFYNNYMFSQPGISLNSVETIVFNDAGASNVAYIQQKIKQAEAIWFAGDAQWDYISYWRNTAIDSLINDAILNRNVVIGGTSAGMAILGEFYFPDEQGEVTSAQALHNPYHPQIDVDSAAFIENHFLENVITDTDYDSPNNRKGRHVVFMARMVKDYGVVAKGIACDKNTAICMDENGIARVYGNYPSEDDNAYFLQTNCELSDITPENCTDNNHVEWNLGQKALKVYHVLGTPNGDNTFSLNDWKSGLGGSWENWYVSDGSLSENLGFEINCELSLPENLNETLSVYPNPFDQLVSIESGEQLDQIDLLSLNGKLLDTFSGIKTNKLSLDFSTLAPGVYYLKYTCGDETGWRRIIRN